MIESTPGTIYMGSEERKSSISERLAHLKRPFERPFEVAGALLGLPLTFKEFVHQLRELNRNLQVLNARLESLPEPGTIEELTEVGGDFRQMIAPLLGYIVRNNRG